MGALRLELEMFSALLIIYQKINHVVDDKGEMKTGL